MWSNNSQGSYHYTLSPSYGVQSQPPPKWFTQIEIEHILIAFTVLTFDFWVIEGGISGFDMFLNGGAPTKVTLIQAIPLALLIAATGFFSHEMAHKFVAMSLGLRAWFQMNIQSLFLSVISAFIGLLYAAPGATMIAASREGKTREMGVCSLAGPLMNLTWTGAFLGAALLPFHYHGYQFWSGIFFLVAFVNTWFALFNLIPFGPLDGKKILTWNKGVFAAAFVGTLALFIGVFLF